MKKFIYFSLLAIVVAISFLISKPENSPTEIGITFKSTASDLDYWRVVYDGALLASNEFNCVLDLKSPEFELDFTAQISIVEYFIDKKKDVIIIAPTDFQKLAPVCLKAIENGIEIIVVDSALNLDGVSCFISTDNIKLGSEMASIALNSINLRDDFAIVAQSANTSTALDRIQGILNVLSEENLTDIVYCNGDLSTALHQTISLIENNVALKCIFAINELSAIGAALAIDCLDLSDEITLITCDSSYEQLYYLESGVIDATIIQKPLDIGYFAVKSAHELLLEKHVSDVITDCIAITSENMYTTENQQILFYSTGNK